MRRRLRNQLALDLDPGRPRPLQPAPKELLKALADLLLEALGSQPDAFIMPPFSIAWCVAGEHEVE